VKKKSKIKKSKVFFFADCDCKKKQTTKKTTIRRETQKQNTNE